MLVERCRSEHGFLPLLSPDGRRAHLKIPKCGSRTVQYVLHRRDGWSVYTDPLETDLQWTALVRHPVDRWLSGIAQCYDESAIKLDMDQAVAHMVHDIHTTPQASWLRGFDPVLFKLENIEKLWHHLGIVAHTHEQRRRWDTKFLTADQSAKIMDHYADDMALYEEAK